MAHMTDYWLGRLVDFEGGIQLHSYQDPGGIWTIGVGHTGPDVTAGTVITAEAARALLRLDLTGTEAGVEVLLAHPAMPSQFDAMVSLAFNIGVRGFQGSDVLAHFNANDFLAAAESFWAYIHDEHGVIQPGLVRRRVAEAVRFSSPIHVYQNPGEAPA